MQDILMWVVSIVLKTVAVCAVWVLVKHLVRNGAGTLKELLTTATMAIRYGCLKLRQKLVCRLQEAAKEEEPKKEDPEEPEVLVYGTVK